jgi:hypothetical protein
MKLQLHESEYFRTADAPFMSLLSLTALGLTAHPLRDELDQEFHARPFERLKTPSLISHLALLSGPGREAINRRSLRC